MESPIPPDPYVALGVSTAATANEIKAAYRKLVLKCHPDKIADETLKAKAVDEFHKVQQAYEIISDEEKRGRYDALVRLAELRRQKLEMRGSNPNADVRSSAYDIRTAGPPQSSFSPRGPTRSYTFDERRTSHYSDEEMPRASARKTPPEYAYVRRSPLDRERDRARDKDSERLRRDDDRRRTERRRDVDRDADRRSKYSPASNEDFAKYEESRRRRDRDEKRREGTDERASRVFEEAQAYINSQRPSYSRTTSSRDVSYSYVRRSQAEGNPRRSNRDSSPRDRRAPEIVSPTTLKPQSSDPFPKKPEPHRSYSTQTDYDRRREDDAPPFASIHRSYTMPTQPASASARKPPQPTKLRTTEIPDSGYSSPATPERQYPPPPPGPPPSASRTTHYHYPDASSSGKEKYQTIYREPGSDAKFRRAASPVRANTAKTANMMANLATSARASPKRSSTYAYAEPTSRASPRSSRSPERLPADRERGRRDRGRDEPRSKLYGEIPASYTARDPRVPTSYSPEEVSYGRRFGRDDVIYSREGRSGEDYRTPPRLSRQGTAVY